MAVNIPSALSVGAHTGSFSKLITSGSDFKADIEFGQLADPVDDGTYNEVLAVDFGNTPETQIDGTIAKIKIITGGAIAYKTFQ